ncbi:MAG: hypothetical protein ACRD2J_17565 [Thermoanaerobaculia bacterium]
MGRKSRAKRERANAARSETIEELRTRVEQVCGPAIFSGETSEEIESEFLRQIIAFHEAEEHERPPLEVLREMGKVYASASRLDDAEVARELRRLVEDLAFLGIYLTSTDHLSDRELYEKLTGEMLLEPTTIIPDDPSFRTWLDPIGGFGEEDIQVYLRYYADEERRADWKRDSPDETLPPHETLPYDRDRFLPDGEARHANRM